MSELGFEEVCAQASAAIRSGNYQEGRELYSKVICFSPESSEAYYDLATCNFMLEDLEAVIEHFENVTDLNPQRATTFINLGEI